MTVTELFWLCVLVYCVWCIQKRVEQVKSSETGRAVAKSGMKWLFHMITKKR